MVIGPPRIDIPPNRCLVPNTRAICSWATREKISFTKWHADLDSWVVYSKDVPVEWSKQNRVVEAPELEIEEHRTPSKRAHHGTPPAGSVAKRTRSKVEHDVGSSKRDKFKSLVIELHDSPVRDTSLSLITPAVGTVGPPLVPTTEVVLLSSLDFEARMHRKKTTARRAKTVSPNVESSFGEVSSQPFKPLFVSLFSFFFLFFSLLLLYYFFLFLFLFIFLHWHIFLFAVSRPIDLVTVREPNLKTAKLTLWTSLWVLVTFCYLPYHPMSLPPLMAFLSQVILPIPQWYTRELWRLVRLGLPLTLR